jgi:saccharopine dehydrogenase (NAD+, L-lysine-forming)
VDARSPLALCSEAIGSDVLVNAASYRHNMQAMEGCLRAGCHYIDLGGLYWMTGRQLELDDRFREAGLLALLGMGSSPGKTNVMAAHAVRELGEAPVSIDIVAAGRDPGAEPDGLTLPYALTTLLDEVRMAPVALREGHPVELEPLAAGGLADLPEPIGPTETIYTLHSELRTLGASFGCREAAFRLSLAPPVLEALRRLAVASPAEVEAAAARVHAPSARAVSIHRVEAAGSARSVRVTAVSRPMDEWGLGGGVVSTAAPAAAAVRLLARGRIGARGALPPERCIQPAELFAELELRACTFTTEPLELALA